MRDSKEESEWSLVIYRCRYPSVKVRRKVRRKNRLKSNVHMLITKPNKNYRHFSQHRYLHIPLQHPSINFRHSSATHKHHKHHKQHKSTSSQSRSPPTNYRHSSGNQSSKPLQDQHPYNPKNPNQNPKISSPK